MNNMRNVSLFIVSVFALFSVFSAAAGEYKYTGDRSDAMKILYCYAGSVDSLTGEIQNKYITDKIKAVSLNEYVTGGILTYGGYLRYGAEQADDCDLKLKSSSGWRRGHVDLDVLLLVSRRRFYAAMKEMDKIVLASCKYKKQFMSNYVIRSGCDDLSHFYENTYKDKYSLGE